MNSSLGKFGAWSLSVILAMTCICGCACRKNIEQESVCMIDKREKVVNELSEGHLSKGDDGIDQGIIKGNPPETLVLKLSNEEFKNWKEVTKNFGNKEAVVEYIPIDQNAENWRDIISVFYLDRSVFPENCHLDNIVNRFREIIVKDSPFSKITWNTIEISENEIVLEWIVEDPHKKARSQHNLSKHILTERGHHHVILNKLDVGMTSEEREKWVKVLRESTKVIPFEKAGSISGAISLANSHQGFLDLELVFPNWRVLSNFDLGKGRMAICHIPPSHDEFHVTECVEILTAPTGRDCPIDQIFEAEKKALQNQFSGNVSFALLESLPKEIIYSYFAMQDSLQLTAIVRTFIDERGFCRLCYKKGLPQKMSIEEILVWKEKLRMIKQR